MIALPDLARKALSRTSTIFENVIAIVTGGEPGIGAACVTALAGASVCVVATYFQDETAVNKAS
jgi:NAD(P)-dependent dehydrogenase (short-subunit alcohol dehydrogenase family)